MKTHPIRRFAGLAATLVGAIVGQASGLPPSIFLVSNFHPACCGWLADWSTERNYCANTYLDHLDRVRDDPNYSFALSEVPNMLAMLQFEPGRVEELKQRIREGRVELVNAFFLEPTVNLSGGEALVKCGLEGLRWQSQVLGSRPRMAWMIDITGMHEQMPQIVAGLGLDAMAYCRYNPTGSTLHWIESPDGTRALAVSPGHYSEWPQAFTSRQPLAKEQVEELVRDARRRADSRALTQAEIGDLLKEEWSGTPRRTPQGLPVLVLGGSGDYSQAPLCRSYPTRLIEQWKEAAPECALRFSTPGKYLDAVLPAIRSGQVALPLSSGGTKFGWSSFWIQSPRAKSAFRHAEHRLQAAEMLSSIASLKGKFAYPGQPFYHAWIELLLNMDRNSLWGAAGGMVFEHDKSWDVRDRYASVEAISTEALSGAMGALLHEGKHLALFNPLNWRRSDPFEAILPPGQIIDGAACQPAADGATTICRLELPSVGTVGVKTVARSPKGLSRIDLPPAVETRYYRAVIDPKTGALTSLRLKGSGQEMLEGPANEIVAEKTKRQQGDPGDYTPDRSGREKVAVSSQSVPRIQVTAGSVATVVEIESSFVGGGLLRRTVWFYQDSPRIDFETELNDVPDRTVVVAEFPLAHSITEVRRGIPYGFSHGAPALHSWTKGISPAIRWSHYGLEAGGGVALLDRGLPGRELTGKTPIIFLLNATDKYYGYPNAWLSGKGKHRLSYALVAHDGPWETARIPQMAWEYNSPPVVVLARKNTKAQSYIETSPNVIVEAMRREGSEIELRMVECVGRPANVEIKINLPHREAALTDLTGGNRKALKTGKSYSFPIRSQQIVTMRLRTERPIPEVEPLLSWEPLVPEAKRAALNRRLYRKGHPPRGDEAARPLDSKADPDLVEKWREMRLGMFIHWGPVSLKGTEIGWSRGGERRGIGGTGEIPLEVYDNLYKEFNPTKFNAREWVGLARDMGAKYLVFTTKHHDGFCMFDSKLTDYKIANSPFKRDVVKELAEACHEAGVKLGFYYSPPDWRHPDYRTNTHPRYVEYLHGQLKELCSNYGKVSILWFDGLNSTPEELDSENLLPMIRYLQPGIIVNNRAGLPADHDTPEQTIGHFQSGRAWESCITLGDQWAWKPNENVKSLKQCVQTLVRCAGGDGNLLFNVGPMPTGEIEPSHAARLREMGNWLGQYGQMIYATRGGPFRPGEWGASTCRGNTIYLHVFNWPGADLVLPGLSRKILSAVAVTKGQAVFSQTDEVVTITVPPEDRQEIDTIVALELDGPAFDAKLYTPPSLAKGKKATASNVYQNLSVHGPDAALDDDEATRWATDAGVHSAWLEVDLGEARALGGVWLSEAYDRVEEFEIQCKQDGEWRTIAQGGKIGAALELKLPPTTAQYVRLNVLKATDGPTIWEFRLFPPKP